MQATLPPCRSGRPFGSLAIDEVHDGPFCVLSIGDSRRHHRLAFRVLDPDPTAVDIRSFLGEFQAQLETRQLRVKGITTDGSPLYPSR